MPNECVRLKLTQNINFLLFLFSILLIPFTLSAIEVGGHLTEDTTWSPDNNPYEVIENVRVASGATLTILPGTEVKVGSAIATDYDDWHENFSYQNGITVAKFFWIDGSIIAEGTSQDSIIFTRLIDDPDQFWGCMYIPESARDYRFKHCRFEYTAGISLWAGRTAWGALNIYDGSGKFRNLFFYNNSCGVQVPQNSGPYEFINNRFIEDEYLNEFVSTLHHFQVVFSNPFEGGKEPLFANNYFSGRFNSSFCSVNFVSNTMANNEATNIYMLNTLEFQSYYYDNTFINNDRGLYPINLDDSVIYIRKNEFIDTEEAIHYSFNDNISGDIRENRFINSGVGIDRGNFGRVFNNFVDFGILRVDETNSEVHNNILLNCPNGLSVSWNNDIYNNIVINNQRAISNNAISYTNCILVNNDYPYSFNLSENPVLRNCIVDFPIEYPLIDGGNNIIVDSLQVQSIFADIQNGDFHLAPGSIAIDAGFDTLGYYYPFDFDFNYRVWDGDGNGSAIIDIGPYEYGSPSFGGIQGITSDPTTGEPVDYVLIKINNEPGEFTFSDSIGNFEYKLPTGNYNVYAERVFYDDVIEYHVEVVDGQFTQIEIPMYETVGVNEPTIPNPSSSISNLTNYPNPFNPSTTISFSLYTEISDDTELVIYNLKGQKIKHFSIFNNQYSITWHGTDENNKAVSSGIYFVRLKVGTNEVSRKILLLK